MAVENQNDYLTGFYYNLSFKGADAAFQEVSGISKEMSIEEVVGGGENRFKYRLPTTSSSQNLVLKRAMVPASSKLIKWVADTINSGLAKKIKPKDVTVRLFNSKGKPARTWVFHNAYPVKYAVSDLKSQENQLAIESIELAYTYFDVV
jgi:phage tail-like protein|tara:strand:+ start:19 stop:465 length:447 start_codon:yes stop_codon:yes gene_type:complete